MSKMCNPSGPTMSAVPYFMALLSLCLLVSADEVPVNITAKPGEDVSLPCRAPSNTDIIVAEWTRPGLEPEYVLLYRDGGPDPENQFPSFKDRVDLKDGEMKDGDVSMILKNVNRDDTGTYECHVFQRNTNRRKRATFDTKPIRIINLQVQSGDTGERGDKEGGDKEGGDEEGGDEEGEVVGNSRGHVALTAVVFVAVVALVGGLFHRKRKGLPDQSSYTAPPAEEPQSA